MSRFKRQIVVLILSALLVANLVCILIVEKGDSKKSQSSRQLLHLKTNQNGHSEYSNVEINDVADNLPEDFEVPGWRKGVSTDAAHYLNPGKETAHILPWKGSTLHCTQSQSVCTQSEEILLNCFNFRQAEVGKRRIVPFTSWSPCTPPPTTSPTAAR